MSLRHQWTVLLALVPYAYVVSWEGNGAHWNELKNSSLDFVNREVFVHLLFCRYREDIREVKRSG